MDLYQTLEFDQLKVLLSVSLSVSTAILRSDGDWQEKDETQFIVCVAFIPMKSILR